MPRNTDHLLAIIYSLKAVLASKDSEIEHLKLVIAKLQRQQFGRRAESHPASPDLLDLSLQNKAPLPELDRLVPAPEPKPSRQHPTHQALPAHLPRDIHLRSADDRAGCPDCGGDLHRIGEDVSEVLEYIPARFRVIRHVRPKLACGCCSTIAQCEAPERLIMCGIAGPGLLA